MDRWWVLDFVFRRDYILQSVEISITNKYIQDEWDRLDAGFMEY